VAALGLAELGLYVLGDGLVGLVAALLVFFVAFNLLEAILPSLVAKTAPAAAKGTALGFFSSAQFLGAFSGGLLGGWAHQSAGVEGVFLVGAGAAFLWLLVAAGMSDPRPLSTRLVKVGTLEPAEAQRLASLLSGVPGVAEAVVVAEDGVAYLKVDSARLDQAALDSLVAVRP
jgi:MFS family permease